MEEFDYTRALRGGLVILRSGAKAKIFSRLDYQTEGLFTNVNEKTVYIGVILNPEQKSTLDPDKKTEPIPMMWDRLGHPFTYKYDDYVPTEHDIVGYEPTYKTVNGTRIKRLDFIPKHGDVYFLTTPTHECLVTSTIWNEDDPDHRHQLRMGLLYPNTKEGKDEATKHAKAMLVTKD